MYKSTCHLLKHTNPVFSNWLVIVLFMVCTNWAAAQDASHEKLLLKQRARFVFNLIQQTAWNNIDDLEVFKIGVIGDDPIMEELQVFGSNRMFVGLPIKIDKYYKIEDLKNLQVLYVNKKFDFNIEQINEQITGENTLLISENYLFNESMINIITTNNTFQFELNEEALNAEKFMVTPAVRQLAITSSERWHEMYKASEKNLEQQRKMVEQQLNEIEKHKQDIEEQKDLLNAQKLIMTEQTVKISSQSQEISQQSQVLREQEMRYQNKISELTHLEKDIIEQKKNLEKQQLSVKVQDSILSEQQEKIDNQQHMIDEQINTLSKQETTIKLQQKINYLLIALSILGVLALIVILKNYLDKKASNKKLVQLNEEKNKLIGVVSHDLRNPTNQIKGLANLLLLDGGENLSAAQKEYINSILASCDRQTDMIKRILDVNAIESNKININAVNEDIVEITRVVTENFKISADKKSIELNFSSPLNKVEAEVDKNYLIQVIENVISNAIKYSEKDTSVDVGVVESGENLLITVADQGPGISEEDKRKMFGTYQKLSAKPTDGEESYGLGLSIVRKYIEAMGGTIHCESELGKGSTFIITFAKAA